MLCYAKVSKNIADKNEHIITINRLIFAKKNLAYFSFRLPKMPKTTIILER